MQKGLLFLFVMIFLVPSAFAESKIYSGTAITGQYVKLTEGTFRFTYDEGGNQIFVLTPTINMIIKNHECKSNGVFKVCINSADYYDRNITTYETYYKIAADIYKETGSLSANSTASSASILQKESVSVKITISNPTDLDVSGIKYAEDFYPFTILNATGCSLEGSIMKWSGSLQPRYAQACTVALYPPEKSATYNFAGNLNYFNGFSVETSSTDTLSINVLPKQLNITQSSDSSSEIDKQFYINLSLANINVDENLDVSVKIPVSNNFIVIKKTDGIYNDNGILAYTARLYSGKTVNLSISLKPSSAGNFSISKKFSYTIKNLQDTMEDSTYINIINPAPVIDLVSEYPELAPGQKFIIFAKLRNPSAIYTLNEIHAGLSIPYLDGVKQELRQLGPNESYTIISNAFILPHDYPADYLNVNLGVGYMLNGVSGSANKSIELKIKQKSGISNNSSLNSLNPPTATQNSTQQSQNPQISNPQAQLPQPAQNANSQTHPKESKFILPKPDFSDKKVFIFLGILFALLFIVPAVIYKIKKNKKENLIKPKDF